MAPNCNLHNDSHKVEKQQNRLLVRYIGVHFDQKFKSCLHTACMAFIIYNSPWAICACLNVVIRPGYDQSFFAAAR